MKQVKKELDARLPYKRARTAVLQTNGSSARPWSNGEISTLIYGVMRYGEQEFSDLMNQTLFLKREHESKDSNTDPNKPNSVALIPEK